VALAIDYTGVSVDKQEFNVTVLRTYGVALSMWLLFGGVEDTNFLGMK
jgi:hypothetical protein